MWPESGDELIALQARLGVATPPAWTPPSEFVVVACFVCFGRSRSGPGEAGEPGWAAALAARGRKEVARGVISGVAGAAYEPGLLAGREGRLLAAAVRRVLQEPIAARGNDAVVVLVNATGRDHPRRAGLALHLGAALDLPSVGVTDRPLCADGDEPPDIKGAAAPLVLDDELVGYRLRSRVGARPIAVHAAWRTTPEAALEVARRSLRRARTPEPLRRARKLARTARAGLIPATL